MAPEHEQPSASATAPSQAQDELALWLDCAQQVAGVSGNLLRLAAAELDLAMASVRRLFMLALLLIPLALLTWLGISVLVAWLGYMLGLQFTEGPWAVFLGLGFFVLQQVAVVLLVLQLCRVSRENMRFVRVRRHFQLFREGLAHGVPGRYSESK